MSDDDYIFRVPREEKTDWKNDIRRALVAPSYTNDQFTFKRLVKNAVHIVANTYPRWNAFKEVNAEIEAISKKHDASFVKWCSENHHAGKFVKHDAELYSDLLKHQEIWDFMKNYCAARGMLVEGPRDSSAVDFEVEDFESANEE